MVWYGMVWYGMVWYGMVWYGMVWYGMVWYGMVWYGMVWYGMVWYGMVWYGMVWYGMVWYGMVWYGMSSWSGLVWSGLVWSGLVSLVGMVCYGMACHTRYYGMVSYGLVISTAGNDTTASSLAAAMAMLALNPEKQAKLRQELTRLGGRVPAAADVEQLQYLDGVCRETLRLYPAASVFARRLSPEVDDVLGGYRVPGNSVLFMSPQVRSSFCSPPSLPHPTPSLPSLPFPFLMLHIESVLPSLQCPVASLLILLMLGAAAGYGTVTGAVDQP